jgi:outer membrane protein OmpA-like peptidoglycan-associated protein
MNLPHNGRWLAAISLTLVATTSSAQMQGYWTDSNGTALRDGVGQCVRTSTWSAQTLHPACDTMPTKKVIPPDPDRVVLLPSPDGSVGAVMVQSKQGRQLINSAYGGLAVAKDGALTVAAMDPADVQRRYGAVLVSQPERPMSFVVRFASGSATQLEPDALPILEQIKQVLKTRRVPEITVIGHTDRVGSVAANDALSLKRAQAVRQILVAAGLDSSSMEVAGRGEREPLVATQDEVAEPKNRRVELNLR